MFDVQGRFRAASCWERVEAVEIHPYLARVVVFITCSSINLVALGDWHVGGIKKQGRFQIDDVYRAGH